ncbi:MAG: PTS transporter subunit EIIC [Anaerostipes hadrus]
MMQKIQKFGGAMFTPVLLFAFAGISVGIGTLFTTQAIMGSLAAPTSTWYKCWNVFLQGGWTVFNQLPLLFAVSLPIGMAKKQNARCCMEALVLYMTFHYFVNTILTQWGGVFGVNMNAGSRWNKRTCNDRKYQNIRYGYGWSFSSIRNRNLST